MGCIASRKVPLLSGHPLQPERPQPGHAAVSRVRRRAVQRRPVRGRRRVRTRAERSSTSVAFILFFGPGM
jgi:hypothetical protein